ncbi:MAG: hypothetical protein K5694_04935, partial [Bacilli bacterium]|nr:hypothetical protein [Bacilli bacterium]
MENQEQTQNVEEYRPKVSERIFAILLFVCSFIASVSLFITGLNVAIEGLNKQAGAMPVVGGISAVVGSWAIFIFGVFLLVKSIKRADYRPMLFYLVISLAGTAVLYYVSTIVYELMISSQQSTSLPTSFIPQTLVIVAASMSLILSLIALLNIKKNRNNGTLIIALGILIGILAMCLVTSLSFASGQQNIFFSSGASVA